MLPRRLSRIIRDRERVRHSGRSNSYTFYRSRREIAEAPPVADAARRFRGSAPIGGHDSGRESAGTTVGRSQWPRSKLGASAVRRRGNFVRRNRNIRNTPASHPCFADRGLLSAISGRKCPKNAVKTHGFEILPRLEHVPCGRTPPREPSSQIHRRAFASPLRLQPLAAHADPRCPVISGMPPASTAQTKNPPHLLPCTRRGDPRGRPRSAHLVALP